MIKTLSEFWLIPWIILTSFRGLRDNATYPQDLGLKHGESDLHRWFGPRYRPRPPRHYSGREVQTYRAAYDDAFME